MINAETFWKLPVATIVEDMQRVFTHTKWITPYVQNAHHGYLHGEAVWKRCQQYLEHLAAEEKDQFLLEAKEVGGANKAKTALRMAALFHDCGRLNDQGVMLGEEQNTHHLRSSERATLYCNQWNNEKITQFVQDAILGHDFQGEKRTPHLQPPKTVIGKILQSADQIGWTTPDSVERTIAFNEEIGAPLYDPSVLMRQRVAWRPQTKELDAVTVLLHNMFQPTGEQRFGIQFARELAIQNLEQLREEVKKRMQQEGLEREFSVLLEKYRHALSSEFA